MGDSAIQLPAVMQAVVLKGTGGVDQLQLADLPVPSPGPGEVLVKVHAAGVNRPDVLQRQGLYPAPPGANPNLGLEVSGVVVGVGQGVSEGLLSKPVMGLCNGGGYAEYVCIPAGQCMQIPAGLGFIEAASLPEVYMTVWQNLFMKGAAKAGQTVLIHGGSSGIGTAAILLCKKHGLRTLVTVGSVDKADFCLRLGADKAYLYKSQDWEQLALQDTQNQGVDLVLDMVAGDYLNRDLNCVKPGGMVIVIALLGGRHANIDASRLMMKQVVLTGSTLRPRSAEFKAHLAHQVEAELNEGFASGKLKSLVQATFPLQEVGSAHALMESGDSVGKIVLRVLNQGQA
ncbi:MAG TPA: NAD(P)H-quinone oxidoreductase [Limnobacter sp.]|nr:NAD(P)H-quinone oxidoreductase [Limnobacter sp.]